jgi:hypothetical protein
VALRMSVGKARLVAANAVNLKNVLGYVNSDCDNFLHGRLSPLRLLTTAYGTSRAGAGGRPPHQDLTDPDYDALRFPSAALARRTPAALFAAWNGDGSP